MSDWPGSSPVCGGHCHSVSNDVDSRNFLLYRSRVPTNWDAWGEIRRVLSWNHISTDIDRQAAKGLTHHVERAIEKETFNQILDPAVPDWPVEEALCLAKLALECAELRRKDRPDLGKVVLPELERLAAIAEESMFDLTSDGRSGVWSPSQSHYSLCQVTGL